MGQVQRSCFLIAAAVLLAAPLAVEAQQAQAAAKVYRVGFVSPTSPGAGIDALRKGLRELGYVEGQNVIVEARYAEGRTERLPDLIAEVIGLKVDVLVIATTAGALAAKRATATVPVVFGGVVDPVASGIVASLERPGGNITGATFGIDARKWLELLKEAVPGISHVAVLRNSTNAANPAVMRAMEAAAATLNVRLDVLDAPDPAKLEAALAAIGASGARGLVVTPDPFFNASRAQLVQFAANKRLPAVYFAKEFVDIGGLMSYASSLTDSYRRAATHVDKILKGAKPADLPIDPPTNFDLVINLKTARALGIPQSLLSRADQVIE